MISQANQAWLRNIPKLWCVDIRSARARVRVASHVPAWNSTTSSALCLKWPFWDPHDSVLLCRWLMAQYSTTLVSPYFLLGVTISNYYRTSRYTFTTLYSQDYYYICYLVPGQNKMVGLCEVRTHLSMQRRPQPADAHRHVLLSLQDRKYYEGRKWHSQSNRLSWHFRIWKIQIKERILIPSQTKSI